MKRLLDRALRQVKHLLDRQKPAKKISPIAPFLLTKEEALARDSGSDLEKIFFEHEGRIVHKWIDYLPIYSKLLDPYRGTKVRLLEIGVSKGGSLEMWRKYLGSEAIIFGVDINPECAKFVSPPNEVRIGSQHDATFLSRVISEMGPPDIVIDDGSHIAEHQLASFRTLWPAMNLRGLYIIEDAHTAYWLEFQGGHSKPGTAVDLAKKAIDDMHEWYHEKGSNYVSKEEVLSISIFDSLIVLEKGRKHRPGHFKTGVGEGKA